jgi:hypothetical protein
MEPMESLGRCPEPLWNGRGSRSQITGATVPRSAQAGVTDPLGEARRPIPLPSLRAILAATLRAAADLRRIIVRHNSRRFRSRFLVLHFKPLIFAFSCEHAARRAVGGAAGMSWTGAQRRKYSP